MRIEAATLRGARATAFAVVLTLLSFLLLSALCSAVAHEWQVGHAHASGSTHDSEPASGEHCHHNGNPVHHEVELDRALLRPHDGPGHPKPADHRVPDTFVTAPTVLNGRGDPWPDTDGPPTPGRLLLIVLSVARN